MKQFTDQELEEIKSFLGTGFSIRMALPGNGFSVKVITDHLNVYECRFESFCGNQIWEYNGMDLREKEETVLAWKYLEQ